MDPDEYVLFDRNLQSMASIDAGVTLHHKTSDSLRLRKLMESPRVSAGNQVPPSSRGLRGLVRFVRSPIQNPRANSLGYGSWTIVRYLYGDERRAVRLAIIVNRDFIVDMLSSSSPTNGFAQNWGSGMYQMLIEELGVMNRNGLNDTGLVVPDWCREEWADT
jgi:hypothetical protein